MSKRNLILIAIFFIGFFVRFVRLGDVPVGLHRDDAFFGYNAYSILKTTKDINGNFLPLHIESLIYSPAGYSYFAIPSIYIFGLNSFSTRFPSAFFGSLTVVLCFFLVRKLFKEEKFYNLAILSSLFLAVSPWHVNLSRISIENTIAVFFISLGTFLFLNWVDSKKNLFLFLSFLSFGLTLFVYQAPRVFLPFFIPLLILCFVSKNRRRLYAFSLFLLVLILPLFLILKTPNLSSRIKSLDIFDNPQTQLIIDEEIREDGVSGISNFITRIFHNKAIGYSSLVLQNYFKHFSYDFLFTDNHYPERFKIYGMGLLYVFELPLIFLGALYLLKVKRKETIFLLSWVIIAPIGSSLTFHDVPNLQRILLIFPALSIISAAGLVSLVQLTSRVRYRQILLAIFLAFFMYNVSFYLHQYYVHSIKHHPWFMNEGYKELVAKVNAYLPNYNKAIITNRETAPTIFFLFYGNYDPSSFQNETKGRFGSNSDSVDFNKYKFTDKECPLRTLGSDEKTNEKLYDSLNTGEKGVLYVNDGNCELPKIPVNELADIKRSDGSIVFRVFEVKK